MVRGIVALAAVAFAEDASLRGLAAVSERVAWAGGTAGTILRTVDGGRSWKRAASPAPLDFRDIESFDAKRAIAMSAGPGAASRVYATRDGGATWTLLLQNRDEAGFYDAIAFWNPRRGVLLGDPVNGCMTVLLTSDGGVTWKAAAHLPDARPGEGAFAASGTCLRVGPGGRAWFATGGPGGGRVYRSSDWGAAWQAAETPVRHDDPAAGIFSLAFRARFGLAVGGHYRKPDESVANLAVTEDGGVTWAPSTGLTGYRSAVAFGARGFAIATGPNGTDVSHDGGRTWTRHGDEGWHTVAIVGRTVWFAGDRGRVAARPQPRAAIQASVDARSSSPSTAPTR